MPTVGRCFVLLLVGRFVHAHRRRELPELAGVDLLRSPTHLAARSVEGGVEEQTGDDQGVVVAEVSAGSAAMICGSTVVSLFIISNAAAASCSLGLAPAG